MCELKLDLSRHCVETEIRRQHNRLISEYFRADEQQRPGIEARLEMIRLALDTFDFGALRSLDPRLAGGLDTMVSLVLKDGGPVILMDGQDLAPVLKEGF